MKLFERPWLEIVRININDILTESPIGTGSIPDDVELGEGGDIEGD